MAEVVAVYDMSEDAMGLGDFITQQMELLPPNASPVVYVEDHEGRPAGKAEWVKNVMSDGSGSTYELRITFED